jgi:hypothetical protein
MTTVSIALNPLLFSQASPGLSEDAREIEQRLSRARGVLDDVASYETARRETIQEIERVLTECSTANWDGHGAAAIDPRSCKHAVHLVLRLPLGTVSAEITAEPDGEIALEWHRSPQKFLFVSVGRNRELTYTWRFGHERGWGVRQFEDEIPSDILACLGRIAR